MQREPNSSLPYHPDRLRVHETGFEPATDGVSHHAKRRRITARTLGETEIWGKGRCGPGLIPAPWIGFAGRRTTEHYVCNRSALAKASLRSIPRFHQRRRITTRTLLEMTGVGKMALKSLRTNRDSARKSGPETMLATSPGPNRNAKGPRMASIDLTGKRFTRLVVLRRMVNSGNQWWVRCDCGAEKLVCGSNLRMGRTMSCGCLGSELKAARALRHNDSRRNKSPDNPRLYNIWGMMRKRCSNPKSISWKDYGARGVTVCPEWGDYVKFKEWSLANGYSPNLTIERKDNDGPYSPENCRWATVQEQMLNKRNTLYVTFNGERIPLKVLCRRVGRNYYSIRSRLVRGWSEQDALADIVIE